MNPRDGSKNGTGTREAPFSTIQAAVERASSGDTISLMPGDYQLVKTVVIAEMAVLHLEAYDLSKPLPRLIDWGIQLQATIGMISNITISDIIIESSSALRIIGTVSDISIFRTQFLMLGPSSEDVIKLDRIKLGGDGTNPMNEIHGIKFIDCVFDTRNSVVAVGTFFFSWRQLLGPSDDLTPNNRLVFERIFMKGGERGQLLLLFESTPYVSFIDSNLSISALSLDDTDGYEFIGNTFDDSGVLMTGNATNVTFTGNTFKNVGSSPFPSLSRPTTITFQPLATSSFVNYQDITITHNTFVNITETSVSDQNLAYAAVLFLPAYARYAYNSVIISFNDFSQMIPSLPAHPSEGPHHPLSTTEPSSSPQSPTTSSNLEYECIEESMRKDSKSIEGSEKALKNENGGLNLRNLYEISSKFYEISSKFYEIPSKFYEIPSKFHEILTNSKEIVPLKKEGGGMRRAQVKRKGPWAINISLSFPYDVNAELNYYGTNRGPSTCCNPGGPSDGPQVTAGLRWYPWCVDVACDRNVTLPRPDCISCSPWQQLEPHETEGNDSMIVVILVTVTLALIVLILGLTALYCFTRAKHPEEYALLPTDGWRSRLLASVPDVQALFDQFGVPLIHFEDLHLNPMPIGTGSFGRVYDGVLSNSDHIVLHKEMHTLLDHQRITHLDTSTLSPFTLSEDSSPVHGTDSNFTSNFTSADSNYFDSSTPDSPYSSTKSLPSFEITSGGTHGTTANHTMTTIDFHEEPRFVDEKGETSIANTTDKRGAKNSSKDAKAAAAKAKKEKEKEKKKAKKAKQPRPIAVKELNSNITDSYEDINQFLEEIKIMASIDHPNLLKLRGVAIDPNTENILLVMDLMDLGSLDDVLFKRKMNLTFARKIAISTEIGYALHYLHSKEPAICHRDLKPGNVLVSRKWNVKVCDFGSSRVLDRKSATMTIKGTPIYLAPESINSSKFSEKTDVYSFGVTLVELFGGTRAFDDVEGSAANLMYRIAAEGLRPTIPHDLPASLKSLLRRCMATDPDDRPNFTDILEKLAEVRAASADAATASLSMDDVNQDPNAPSSSALKATPSLTAEKNTASAKLRSTAPASHRSSNSSAPKVSTNVDTPHFSLAAVLRDPPTTTTEESSSSSSSPAPNE